MDTREELIAKIEFSENALKKMNSLESNIKKLEKEEKKLKNEDDKIGSGKLPEDALDLIGMCIKGLLAGGFIGALIGILIELIFGNSDFLEYLVVFGGAAIGILIPIIKQIRAVDYRKNIFPKELAEMDKKLEEIRAKIKEAEKTAGEYIFSDEFSKAESYVPRDYFYLSAIKKMKYFLVNGHADTMKEALKLYDEQLHREKLEYEAKRAADEARRAADMSEATAVAASETMEYAKIIKEQNDSIEFWTRMNTIMEAETYRKASEISNKLN